LGIKFDESGRDQLKLNGIGEMAKQMHSFMTLKSIFPETSKMVFDNNNKTSNLERRHNVDRWSKFFSQESIRATCKVAKGDEISMRGTMFLLALWYCSVLLSIREHHHY